MVVLVRLGVDVECRGQAPVAVEPEAFVVAFELRPCRGWVGAARETFDFLLVLSARAGDGCLDWAWQAFVAGYARLGLI